VTYQTEDSPMTFPVVTGFTNWPEVVSTLEKYDGVTVCTVEALRNIDGYARLGPTVLSTITQKLASLGVATLRPLPKESSSEVVLYRLGTPVSELIDTLAVASNGGGQPTTTAASLRRLNVMPDPDVIREGLETAMQALSKTLENAKVF
jgi:hypothetical protein